VATPGPAPDPDAHSAVAGLARELEEVGRLVKRLAELPERVTELGDVVAHLADELAAHPKATRPVGPPSWLALPPEGQPSAMLSDLVDWMARVYLRFPDGAQHLPECWLWHPDVIEELTWLRLAWALVYHPALGTPLLVGDWHDRYRPGVVRRIRERAGTCSLECHRDEGAGSAPVVPLAEAVDLIAAWWGGCRQASAPAPRDEHVAAAHRLRRARSGRR
jgi:hypothetical protein